MHHEPEDILALRVLLKDLAIIHARLCEATGQVGYRKAIAAARKTIEDWEMDEHLRAGHSPGWRRKPDKKTYDDRARSTSLRALGGGLPTLGKKRR